MRTIRFRAWDKEEERMLTGEVDFISQIFLSEEDAEIRGIDDIETNYVCELKDCELMQFTGLLDKNGKEIYEGDLIECVYCHKEYGEVYWHKSQTQFRLKWDEDNCGNARLCDIDNWKEIIGNVYQDSHLLDNSFQHQGKKLTPEHRKKIEETIKKGG